MKLNKVLRNNTFLINAAVCLVVILFVCYLGLNSPLKITYSADTCNGTEYVNEGVTICVEAGQLYGDYRWNEGISDEIFPTKYTEGSKDEPFSINFSSNNSSFSSMVLRTTQVAMADQIYSIYYDDKRILKFGPELESEVIKTKNNIDYYSWEYFSEVDTAYRQISFLDKQTPNTKFYDWFVLNATKLEQCYYNDVNKSFEWTHIGAGRTPYTNFTEGVCQYASMNLTLMDVYGGLQNCYSGTCSNSTKTIALNVMPGTYALNDTTSLKYKISREGYKLSGWAQNSYNNGLDFGVVGGLSLKPDGKITFNNTMYQLTLVALWEPIEHTVSFNSDGGSSVASQTVLYGQTVTKPTTNPTNGDYVFLGWYRGNKPYDFNQKVYSDMTLTAKWGTKNALYGNYKWNDGLLIADDEIGKSFAVDFTVNDTTYSSILLSKQTDGSIALNYGSTQQHIFNNCLLGADEVTCPFIGLVQTETLKFAGTNMEVSSYNFLNKNVSPYNQCHYDTTTKKYTWGNLDDYGLVVTDEIDEKSCEAKNYKVVTFDSAGGSIISAAQVYVGDKVAKPEVPTKVGYNFKTWNLNGVEYDFSEPVYEDMTLVATWEPITYTIIFDANGGTGTMAAQAHEYGKELALSENKYTYEGHSFSGWNTVAEPSVDNPGTAYADKALVKDLTVQHDAQVILHAQWNVIEQYTVSYDANGGENAPAAQTKYFDEELELSKEKPSREGYTFMEWNTQKDGSGTSYGVGAKYNSDKKNESVTLYAQWDPIAYTIKFDSNGGTGTMDNQLYAYGIENYLSQNAYTREGYEFAGWKYNNRIYDDRELVKDLTTTDGDVLTFVAQWNIKKLVVSFNVDGNIISTQTVDYGNKLVEPKDPVKEGFVFEYWTLVGVQYNFDAAVTDNWELVAKFRAEDSSKPVINGYEVDEVNKYIKGIKIGTPLSSFEASIVLPKGYTVEVEFMVHAGVSWLHTGGQTLIRKPDGRTYASYTNIVESDVDGNGRLTTMDYMWIYKYFKGEKILNTVNQLAGDLSGDGQITTKDYMLIYKLFEEDAS